MPAAVSPNPRAGATEGSTNYDQDVDDFLHDLPLNNDSTRDVNTAAPKDVDAEVKVRKARIPAPKLDDNLLLSARGIPKLRHHARTKLKFKDKGHEFSDMGRLLSMYQLWLDDMYPKAKFRDGLGMVEKVGHSKRMQVSRRGWMDGTKEGRREESVERIEDRGDDVEMSGGLDGLPGGCGDDLFGEDGNAGPDGERHGERRQDGDVPEEDELDALMTETTGSASRSAQQQPRTAPPFEEDDGPDEDELDAHMAETEMRAPHAKQQPSRKGPFDDDDDDEDELDALMAENMQLNPKPVSLPAKTASGPFDNDEDDGDELDALLAEHSNVSAATQSPTGMPGAPSARQASQLDEFEDEEEVIASMGGMW